MKIRMVLIGAVLVGWTVSAQADFVNAVLSYNPVAYWQFEEASTSLPAANSGTGGTANNGAYSNVTLVAGPSLPGLSGQAASFSGSSTSHVTASDVGFPSGSASRTMIAWIRTTDARETWADAFCYGTATPGLWADIFANPVGMGRQIGAGGGVGAIYDTAAINDGNWHFVAATVGDGGPNLWSLYVDGSLKAASALATPNTVLNQAVIGDWVGMQSNWLGAVDEVAVFGSALNGTQISALYTAATVPEPSSVAMFTVGLIGLLAYAWRKGR